jgi:hypothetical protein
MAILTVGQGAEYSTLASAIAASQSGDTIQVAAGTYTNDFASINDDITIVGVGGMVNLVATVPPPNGKAILVTNGNDTIENVSFSGAKVADANGAGIRLQAGNLVLINDYFHDNQEGLLAGDNHASTLTIKNTEFANNGDGSGFTHNLYVGEIGTLTIDNSLFTNAIVGHEIKSRADNTIIENSRIIDGPTSTSSYSIDLPAGGHAVITNNVIEQGPHSENYTIIHYGATAYANSSLEIAGNTVVNDLNVGSARLLDNQTTVTASITDNQIYGLTTSQFANGPATESGNTILTTEPHLDLTPPWETNPLDPKVLGYLAELPAGVPQPDLTQLTSATATTAGQSLHAQGTEMLIGTATGETLIGGTGFNILVAGSGIQKLIGGAGTNEFLGEGGHDLLAAGVGSNYFKAGTGAELFRLVYGHSGDSTIYGFDPTHDHINIVVPAKGPALTAAGLVASATADSAGDAVIPLGAHELVLANVAPSHVSADWFTIIHG